MAKYDERFKLKVVKQYLSKTLSSREVASAHGIDRSQLRRWVASYRAHGQAGLSHKYSRYSAAFRLHVLEHIEHEGLSDRQAAALYDIRSTGDIRKWRCHAGAGKLDDSLHQSMCPVMPKTPRLHSPPADETRTQKELLDELAYLRAENAYLKKLKALREAEKNPVQLKKRTWFTR